MVTALNSKKNNQQLHKLTNWRALVVLLFVVSQSFTHSALAKSSRNNTNSSQGDSVQQQLSPGLTATFFYSNDQLVARLSNNKQIVLANHTHTIPAYARDIWIADFNYDGKQDIAFTSGFDSSSSDQLYTIMTWDQGLTEFIPLYFQEKLTNLEIFPERREVRSSYQSGKFWVEDTYRFQHGRPYLYSKSQLIENTIWHTIVYNPNGQIIRSLVSKDGLVERPPYPVLLSVNTPTAPIYQQPVPSTQLPLNLKQGDIVSVLDFKTGRGELEWVNISANIDQHVVQGWTLLSNLVQR